MDDLRSTLIGICDLLREHEVPFHVTGGLASSFYGEPRFTQDIDIVVRLEPASPSFARVMTALSERYTVDPDSAREEAETAGMFQALDTETLIKVDLHVGEAIAGELGRSVPREVLPGLAIPLVSREDAILSKLLWIRQGSHKSRHDVVMMLRRTDPLDSDYLEAKAHELGVDDLLAEMRGEAPMS